jgi:tryptophanyl-tRNA synthetase
LLKNKQKDALKKICLKKDKLKQNQTPENANTLLAIYPVLMAADILIQRSKFIPVGEDQKSHIEVTKLLARRFNSKYGNTLPVPEMQLIKPLKLLDLNNLK